MTLLSTFDILQALQHHPHQEQGTENNNDCNSHSPLQMDCEQVVLQQQQQQQSGAISSVNLSALVADQQDLIVQDQEESRSSNASDSSPISPEMVSYAKVQEIIECSI